LKRKGPADKAYKRKQFYGTVGPDTRRRAFLAGIARAKETAGSADFSDRDTQAKRRENTETVMSGFDQPRADNVSMSHTAITNHRLHEFQSHSINLVAINSDNMSANIQQTQSVVSRSDVDDNYGFVQLGFSDQQLLFYQSEGFQDNGNETAACERYPTRWNALGQLHHAQQLVTNCCSHVDEAYRDFHTTSTSLRNDGSQTNQEMYSNSSYPYFSTPLDMPMSVWPCTSCNDFERATGDWFSTNSNSVDQSCYSRQAIVNRETFELIAGNDSF